jgi:maleate cis-trans isomerase
MNIMQTPRRVGTLIPCPNTVIEMEFNRILPPHYQLHAGRLRMGPIDEVGWRMQDADIDYQAELLGSAKIELIILAQTAVSFFDLGYDTAVKARMAKASGAPALTAGEITARAALALGLRRVALLSPYEDGLNELGRVYYQSIHGLDVSAIGAFGRPKHSGEVSEIPTKAAADAMRRVDSLDIDGFIVAGGNFPCMHAIADWERQFRKPVITTNQSSMWAIFRALGSSDSLPGYGRLLESTSG